MADTIDLPGGWTRDFEGALSATYRREPTGIEVVIEPRYTVDRRKRRTPTSYRIRLRRPFWHRQGHEIETALETVDTFDDAKARAREYMVAYNERYRQAHDRGKTIRGSEGQRADHLTATAVAAQVAAETTVLSMDLVIEHLRALVGDGLQAVWEINEGVATSGRIDEDNVVVHYGADEFDEKRVTTLSAAMAELDAETIAETLDADAEYVTVTVGGHVLYHFETDDNSAVVVVDETTHRVEPNFTREVAELFANRG